MAIRRLPVLNLRFSSVSVSTSAQVASLPVVEKENGGHSVASTVAPGWTSRLTMAASAMGEGVEPAADLQPAAHRLPR